MKKVAKSSSDIYRLYTDYIENDALNIASEPSVIYAKSFDDMIEVANYDKDFAAELLDISYKTVSRYQKENKKFSPLQSEYILKTITLFHKGRQIFGSEANFNQWLDKPAYGLGNKLPRKFTTTVGGINFISDELNRIARGDLA